MTKTSFLFSGQGAQKLGMTRDLYDKFDIVKKTFDRASELLSYDLRQLIDSEEEKLNQTEYTQPAILTSSVAIYRLLSENGIKADAVAGLSLGEYSALVASSALDFDQAVQLVAKRGKFMSEAAPSGLGKMLAVMNTDVQLIEDICKQAALETEAIVSPANYNTIKQIVIGGEVKAVNRAEELLKLAGTKRIIELKVSGPFHTALLKDASEKLALELEKIQFTKFQLPLISNTKADIMKEDEIKSLLARQVMEPVRFYESIEKMSSLGVTRYIELGPGKVLSGFVKKILSDIEVLNVEDVESFENILKQK